MRLRKPGDTEALPQPSPQPPVLTWVVVEDYNPSVLSEAGGWHVLFLDKIYKIFLTYLFRYY